MRREVVVHGPLQQRRPGSPTARGVWRPAGHLHRRFVHPQPGDLHPRLLLPVRQRGTLNGAVVPGQAGQWVVDAVWCPLQTCQGEVTRPQTQPSGAVPGDRPRFHRKHTHDGVVGGSQLDFRVDGMRLPDDLVEDGCLFHGTRCGCGVVSTSCVVGVRARARSGTTGSRGGTARPAHRRRCWRGPLVW